MKTINKTELEEILYKHRLWLIGESEGSRADLSNMDLRGVKFICPDLRCIDFCYSDLRGVDMSNCALDHANFTGANIRKANFSGANLHDAILIHADCEDADFSKAILYSANFMSSNLTHVNFTDSVLKRAIFSFANLNFAICDNADFRDAEIYSISRYNTRLEKAKNISFYNACPEKGSFIAFKKANDYIIELFIPEDAKRSSGTSRQCRCNKAKVVSITTSSGDATTITEVHSNYDPDFIYKLNEYVEVEDFDDNRWNEYTTGIHFFISRQEAVDY